MSLWEDKEIIPELTAYKHLSRNSRFFSLAFLVSFQMLFQIVRTGESLRAPVTDKILFAGVDLLVAPQMFVAFKRLLTARETTRISNILIIMIIKVIRASYGHQAALLTLRMTIMIRWRVYARKPYSTSTCRCITCVVAVMIHLRPIQQITQRITFRIQQCLYRRFYIQRL